MSRLDYRASFSSTGNWVVPANATPSTAASKRAAVELGNVSRLRGRDCLFIDYLSYPSSS